MKIAWHTKDIKEVSKNLSTDVSRGLTEAEAKKRLQKYGSNELREKKKVSSVAIFLEQFNDVLIWILLFAVLISIIRGEFFDAIVISVILLINAVLGFVQHFRAEKALKALKALTAPTATVIRQREMEIKAAEVVPGDIILLEAGDRIPADARLVEAAVLQVQESSLTGESAPVNKAPNLLDKTQRPISEQKNMIFMGTSISRGRARAVVVATGRDTEMGKIASLIGSQREPTPLQKELKSVGVKIGLAIVLIAIVVFIVGIAKGNDVFVMLLTAVALAVAAIPEGLPAIVTIILAIGVQYMAKAKAIIRRLHAVETLGSTNYIVTDKTGTLTLNKMSVRRLFVDNKLYRIKEGHIYDLKKEVKPKSLASLMFTAVLANDSRKQTEDTGYTGEPTELALVQAAALLGFDKAMLDYKHERIEELPFESERKKMTTVNKFEGHFRAFTKGAVEVLLSQSSFVLNNKQTKLLTEEEKEHLISVANQEANSGYRVLGFAYKDFNKTPEVKDLEKNMTFVGMAGLLDYSRPEVSEAIRISKKAGINIAMVTGDHLLTAQKIAEEIGLKKNENSLKGEDLSKLSSHELAEKVEKINVYARVDPFHKVKIVEALKEKGYVVAVTGDGVNDAPALSKADIGIAMGITGTDVSKEASDMVLADDNFTTIVKAVRLGRMIFDNLRKFISFLLSANISEVLTIFLGILLFSKGIILLVPIQILWINLVTDAFPALALGVNPAEDDVMERSPRKKEEGILARKQVTRITIEGIILTAAVLSVFSLALLYFKVPLIKAQTMVFTTLVLVQLIHAFNYCSSKTIFSLETFLNRYLIFAFLGSLVLQLAVVYIPFLNPIFDTIALGFSDWLLILVASFIAEILIDLVKVRFFK